MGTYITHLTLQNIKCFGNTQDIELTNENGQLSQWTIIVGENGTGKTTILQSMAMMQPIATEPRPGTLAGYATLLARGAFGPAFSMWNLLASDRVQQLKLEEMQPSDVVGMRLIVARDSKLGESVDEQKEIPIDHIYALDNREMQSFQSMEFPKLALYAYGTYRRSQWPFVSKQTDRGYESLFNKDVYIRNAEQWLTHQNYKISNNADPKHKIALDQMIALLKGILPDIEDITIELENDELNVLAQTPYGKVPLYSLSDGYEIFMTWIVDFCSRQFEAYPDSEDIFKEAAVVLIDEYDLHMHPKWQRDTVSYLTKTFPNVQFIITTHSPLVLQSAPFANIVLLEQKDGHVVVNNDVDKINHWRTDQLLTSPLFGLGSARSPEFEKINEERRKLIAKGNLTSQETSRLEQLHEQLSQLMPHGESPEEIKLVQYAIEIAKMNQSGGEQ